MKNTNYKVFIAIVNQGWIRPEHVKWLLPLTKSGIPFHISFPNLKPASHNRNSSVLDFLKTDYTHYLSIDHDVIPDKSPFELLKEDKDIIGLPAKVIQKGQINWVAYNKDKGDNKYYNPADINGAKGLMNVDIVGTGCILIKREVLENVKAPFMREWNEDGTTGYGLDFLFCIKAKKQGYKIYCATDYKCEHFKELGLNSLDNK